jgi:hypothetical protein
LGDVEEEEAVGGREVLLEDEATRRFLRRVRAMAMARGDVDVLFISLGEAFDEEEEDDGSQAWIASRQGAGGATATMSSAVRRRSEMTRW